MEAYYGGLWSAYYNITPRYPTWGNPFLQDFVVIVI